MTTYRSINASTLFIVFLFSCMRSCYPDPTHVNFFGLARTGQWFNDAGEVLQFGNSNEDPKGFARTLNAVQLEDGLKYDF